MSEEAQSKPVQTRQPAMFQVVVDDVAIVGNGVLIAGEQRGGGHLVVQVGESTCRVDREKFLKACKLYE